MRDLDAYDDQSLMECIKNGDQAAFETLFDRYHALLITHVYRKINSISESEDVVQEIYIKLWERREQIDCDNIAGYLFKAARNRILNIIKHRQVVCQYENDFKRFAETHPINSTEHILQKKELDAILEKEIQKLSPRMRQVFLLSRRDELTHQEIADKLGITKFTVNDHIKSSLRILKSKIRLINILVLWGAFFHF